MEQKKSENGQKIALAAISVILCAALFYFFYYIKTPVYSMKLIGEAVKNHDLETFDRHVDVKHMAGKVFDDFVAKEANDKNGSLAGNAFALGLVTALKPVAVAEMQDAIYAEVAQKDEPMQQKKSEIKVLDRLKNSTKVAAFKGVSTVSKNGDTAIVGVKYHNRRVDKDYTLNVKMEKMNDGKWRAKELTNLLELLDQTEKDEAEKLAEIDKPFKEQVWKNVALTDDVGYKLWEVGYAYNRKHLLDVRTVLLNTSDKVITDVSGFIQLEHVDVPFVSIKRFPMAHFYGNGFAAGQKMATTSEIQLDPYNQTDKYIMQLDRSDKLMARHFVMTISFADGTKIERPTKLPDPD